MSKIIVLEGPDRCGKATQSKLLCDYINNVLKKRATVVEVPIKDIIIYKIIYWMLQNGLAKTFPKLFQLLQFLNRRIFQTFTLPRLESENDFIIMDRWSLSTLVYGIATGISEEFTEKLYYMLRIPDHTVLLLGDPLINETEDVYESDKDLQKKVKSYYGDWANLHPITSSVVNCNLPRQEVNSIIIKTLTRAGLFIKQPN